jgi:ferrochelatase
MRDNEKVGILLINTGTTAAPLPAETRAYLREFLSDPRVIDKPAWARWLILNLFILPRRPKQSAEAYSLIWTEEGSPLLTITKAQAHGLKERMPDHEIEIGMRYGWPSIPHAFKQLKEKGVDRIIAAPLFPQHSSAANGSALQLVYELAAKEWNVLPVSALPPFYDDSAFLDAWGAVTQPVLDDFKPDHILFSYHGLPESQVRKSELTPGHCLGSENCCDEIGAANQHCYRAQCFATTRDLVQRLDLKEDDYTVSFQSRLGRDPWIKPPTDEVVPALAKKGVKRLAVLCPAFVSDCLETLEEITIRAKEDFTKAGGEDFAQVPCLNDHPAWLDALTAMIKRI